MNLSMKKVTMLISLLISSLPLLAVELPPQDYKNRPPLPRTSDSYENQCSIARVHEDRLATRIRNGEDYQAEFSGPVMRTKRWVLATQLKQMVVEHDKICGKR